MRLVKFLLGLAAVIVLAGCDPVPPAFAPPAVRHVDLYGDSLSWYAHDEFDALAPPYAVDYQAQPGWPLNSWRTQGTPSLLNSTAPEVVLALGTNDAGYPGQVAVWADTLNRLPATTCVVWVRSQDWSPTAAAFNAQIAAVVAQHPNARILDWNARVQAHPEYVGPDGVHHTQAGEDAYARALADSMALC